jgi:hypothetical protein
MQNFHAKVKRRGAFAIVAARRTDLGTGWDRTDGL